MGVAGVGVSVALVASTGVSLLPCVSDVGSLESVAFELVVSSILSVSLLVASACAYCSAVGRGCAASAVAAMGNVALTMDVHATAQSR